MIRKNMKLLIGLMIGIMVSSVGVYAVNSLNAESITINNINMSKIETNTLQSALTYLYSQSEKTNMITIEFGVKHLSQTYLGIAYLDPTNLSNKCTAANSVSTTGTKTGCMKWYIYKDLGDSYKMILVHNTTVQQVWNKTGNNGNGTNVEFKANNELMELVSARGWKVYEKDKQRTEKKIDELTIIGADEVADIVGYRGFNPVNNAVFFLDSKNSTTYPNYQGGSSYA